MTPFLRVTKDYPPRRIPSTFVAESVIWQKEGECAAPYKIIPQLMGQTVSDLAPISERLLETVPFVDFNCGCPSPTVVGNGSGSSLLRTPEVFENYLSELSGVLGAERMSIKMRVGFEDVSEFSHLLECASQFPLAQLTIHGRTRTQRYKGYADWKPILQASNRGLKVVGSGDVLSFETFEERKRIGQPQKIIIGRGALRNPFIFLEIKSEAFMTIPRSVLGVQLQVALVLHALFELNPDSLFRWMYDFFPFQSPLKNSLESWEQCREELLGYARRALKLQKAEFELEGVPIPKGSFFKIKMIWNYLRTSLPTESLDVFCLRALSPQSFFECLETLIEQLPLFFEIKHRPEFDWIFSGAGKTKCTD